MHIFRDFQYDVVVVITTVGGMIYYSMTGESISPPYQLPHAICQCLAHPTLDCVLTLNLITHQWY